MIVDTLTEYLVGFFLFFYSLYVIAGWWESRQARKWLNEFVNRNKKK